MVIGSLWTNGEGLEKFTHLVLFCNRIDVTDAQCNNERHGRKDGYRIPDRRIPDRRIPVDGYRIDGYRINGYQIDGYRIDGYRIDRYQIDGYRIDGYRINGYRINGYRIDGYHYTRNLELIRKTAIFSYLEQHRTISSLVQWGI